VVVIDVTEHEVVERSLLAVDVLGPVLAVSLNLEDGLLAVLVIPVDSSEVVVVPFHLRVHALATGKVETGPSLDLVLRKEEAVSGLEGREKSEKEAYRLGKPRRRPDCALQ